MKLSRFSPVAMALALSLGTGCELLTSLDQNKIASSSSAVGSTTGSGGDGGMAATSTASSTSSGMGGGCAAPSECPGMDTDCATRTCVAGECGMSFAAPGTALPAAKQMAGDCKLAVCDGSGAETTQSDEDPLDDGNECTDDSCNAGMPVNVASMSGAMCTMGGKVCDGSKNCVACNVTADCMTGTCVAHVCVPPDCLDMVKNNLETDVDCGGGTCAPCIDGKICGADADCTSTVCTGNTCQIPTCSDGADNGLETDVDCGGTACPTCATGDGCSVNADCIGGSCSGAVCLPTCTDTVKNNVETDVDCGGGTCPTCADGKVCGADGDCASGKCAGNVCQAAACNDGVQNGGETDIDCGGTCPADCGTGQGCAGNGDCVSSVCTANTCQAPMCNDLTKNGVETDVDCGGGTCGACANGKVCSVNTDCTSNSCQGGICAAVTCSNMIKDGAETDIDCGGPSCAGCAPGEICVGNSDCQSDVCTANVCQMATCTDNTQNGLETDVDCGGPCPLDCDDGEGCAMNGDCTSGVCTGNVCQIPACNDLVQNGLETDVDCGGGSCIDCADGDACLGNGDCLSGVCTGNVCQVPACNDGVKNGTESDTDCGGLCAADCLPGKLCGGNADCTTGVCSGGVCQLATCSDGVKNATETDIDCGGGTCPTCADGKLCGANTDCTSLVCTGGACAIPSCTDGVKNGSETLIDCGGTCPACPAVTTTAPADGATNVSPVATTGIAINFNAAMQAATLTVQTSSGPCSGSVQISTDNFATCIGLATPTMSNGNQTLTVTPAPGLSGGTTYVVKVSASALAVGGNALAAYQSATGFTTNADSLSGAQVVISQVNGNGGNAGATYKNDYIELHNRGPLPITLTGWSVQYASQNGSTWTVTALGTGLVTSIPAGGYYLIQEGAGAGGTNALPTPDATGGIAMSGSGGKVALVSSTTALTGTCPTGVVDLVGYGVGGNAPNCFEGAGAAPANTATLSDTRAGSGCTDTDNNASDFSAVAANPRNSTFATLANCSATMNETANSLEADYCVLQFPLSLSVQTGVDSGLVYGRVFETGVTEAAGAPANVIGQVGYGLETVNPENQSGWVWSATTFNVQVGNDDEFQGSFTAPAVSATPYRYTYRFSLDNGTSWTYCDTDGAGSNAGLSFEVTKLPVLTVTP